MDIVTCSPNSAHEPQVRPWRDLAGAKGSKESQTHALESVELALQRAEKLVVLLLCSIRAGLPNNGMRVTFSRPRTHAEHLCTAILLIRGDRVLILADDTE